MALVMSDLGEFHRKLRAGELHGSTLAGAWDELYSAGSWSHLGSLSEAPHYGVIAAYYAAVCRPSAAVLDVGCGHGVMVPYLRNVGYARYLGVDISAVAIEQANALADATTSFRALDVETAPMKSFAPFDAIIINEVLYYFNSPFLMIRRLQKLLSPRGVLIISVCMGTPGDESFAETQPALERIWTGLSRVGFSFLDECCVRGAAGTEWRIGAMKMSK
jgi:2-polyprenyl-3-methyl-5-hydroxy-6-metoxy-1,4-benzoquinol methylase